MFLRFPISVLHHKSACRKTVPETDKLYLTPNFSTFARVGRSGCGRQVAVRAEKLNAETDAEKITKKVSVAFLVFSRVRVRPRMTA